MYPYLFIQAYIHTPVHDVVMEGPPWRKLVQPGPQPSARATQVTRSERPIALLMVKILQDLINTIYHSTIIPT